MGVDLHCSDKVGPLLVQVDRDLDLLLSLVLVDLALVDPLEIDEGQVAAQGFSELDRLVLLRVLRTLHREARQNES